MQKIKATVEKCNVIVTNFAPPLGLHHHILKTLNYAFSFYSFFTPSNLYCVCR